MACFQAVPFLVFGHFLEIVEIPTSVTYNQTISAELLSASSAV